MEQYDVLRAVTLDTVADLDEVDGVMIRTLIEVAEVQLAGHPRFPSGRFPNGIRFVRESQSGQAPSRLSDLGSPSNREPIEFRHMV